MMYLQQLSGRGRAEEQGYVVWRPRSLRGPISSVGIGVVGIAWYLLWFRHGAFHGVGVAFLVFFVLSALYRGLRRTELLRVDGYGVRLGAVMVPWSWVGQVVVSRPERAASAFIGDSPPPPQVGLRLRPGAPLPAGMSALITDPRDPLAIPEQLRSPESGPAIDPRAVCEAVRRWAPADVVLVERVGGQEHPLPR
jgi:hypothetical protein